MSGPQLPVESLRARVGEDVETIAAPSSPRGPWVVAGGELAIKAYDLSHFDAVDRSRLLGEAEAALALADIDGVVDTHGFEVASGWLVIEMERLGESVADHLRGGADVVSRSEACAPNRGSTGRDPDSMCVCEIAGAVLSIAGAAWVARHYSVPPTDSRSESRSRSTSRAWARIP